MTRTLASLAPVFLFLLVLVFLDSYKLVRLRSVLTAVVAGTFAAGASLLVGTWLVHLFSMEVRDYSRFLAPFVEESLKALYLLYLLRSRQIGFLVDAAILGFAVGAGFAVVENVWYLYSQPVDNPLVWLVRGFGTALMHGGATCLLALIARALGDRAGAAARWRLVPALAAAVLVHGGFNWFLLPPVVATAALVVILPVLAILVFSRSERSLRGWLGSGFDTDVALLEMVQSGRFTASRAGQYLVSLQARMPAETIVDALCYLRIYLELSVRAKGVLLMRESGYVPQPDPKVSARLEELGYLRKRIGQTGVLALSPLLRLGSRELWQLTMLK